MLLLTWEEIASLALEAGMAVVVREDEPPIQSAYGLIEDAARERHDGIRSFDFVHGGRLYHMGNL